jgi:hypothetical protein
MEALPAFLPVMAGLVPAIPVLHPKRWEDVGARHEAGHDEVSVSSN